MKLICRKFVKWTVSSLFLKLPLSVLKTIERQSRLVQGKGWGSETIQSEVRAAIELLAEAAIKEIVAIDVGANVGNWSGELLRINNSATVYAFEPSLNAFAQLEERFKDTPDAKVFRCAVGDECRKATLFSDYPGSGLGSFSQRNLHFYGIEFNHKEEVDVVTLDVASKNWNLRPNLLKIDVEGHELSVLRGGIEIIQSIEVVQFEFGGCNIDTRTFFKDFFEFFDEHGFDLYRLGPKGLRKLSSYSEEDEIFQTTNYFAKRRSKESR